MPEPSTQSTTDEPVASTRRVVLSDAAAGGGAELPPTVSVDGQNGKAPEAADASARQVPPYPIAALIRRTRNAKGARDLHDIAFNGWEASMRLAVAVKPPADVSILFEPSTGSWATCVRAVLTDAKLDNPHLKAVHALFSRVGANANASPMFVTPRMLFEYIASYRNNLHGHGAVRGNEFYESAGEILLNGLEAAWRHWIFLPEGGELVFVQSVELDAAGQRRARIYLLKGGEPLLESRIGSTDIPEGLRPRRLYMRIGKRFISLHPWLLYDDKDERERVLYYNGRNKYLDFIGGDTPRVEKLQEAYPALPKELEALFRGKTASVFPEVPEINPNDFGDYEIVCELGHGGMATVCLARQKSLERFVALKMPLPGSSNDPIAMQRFAREIQVLSQCDHPNVVKILDSGVHNNTPYYVMEYIEGADMARIAGEMAENGNIDEAISSASLKVKAERAERMKQQAPAVPVKRAASPNRSRQEFVQNSLRRLAALIRDAARGLHHLHQHDIIHRDIKPGNLMLTDGEHRVVVMDLGLAALSNTMTSLARDTTSLLGTLRYMAPEQLQRQPISLDRRADVYSLSATFYELLAGKPFLDGASEQQLLQQILYEEPMPIGRANPHVPRDIQVIVTKGCQKDPRLRYQTADELAMDLDRFLNGEPIAAREPSLTYLLGLSIRKHKALVWTAVACFVLVVGLAGLAVWMRQDLLVKQQEAEKFARAQEQLRLGSLLENDGQFGEARSKYESALINFGELKSSNVEMDRADKQAVEEAKTHLDLLYLRHLPPIFEFEGHRTDETQKLKGHIFSISISPNDDKAMSSGEENGCGVIKLWDLHAGQPIKTFKSEPGDRIYQAKFSPDGSKVLFTGSVSRLNLWDRRADKVTPLNSRQDPVTTCMAFSPDGKYAVSGNFNGHIQLWDIENAKLTFDAATESSAVRSVAYLDDDTICTGGSSGRISLWRVDRNAGQLKKGSLARPAGPNDKPGDENVFPAHKGGINGLVYIAKGSKIVSYGDDRLIKIWNVADGRELGQAYGHPSEVVAVSIFENDARTYAVSACGTTLRIWDLDKITEPLTVECGWHASGMTSIAVQGKGKRVLTAGADGSLMMWSLPFQKSTPFNVFVGWVRSIRFSANGKLAVACGDVATGAHNAFLLDVQSGLALREFQAGGKPLRVVTFSDDERSVLGVDTDGSLMAWPINDSTDKVALRPIYNHAPNNKSRLSNALAVFSPDSRFAAIAVSEFDLDVVDVQKGSVVDTLSADDGVKVTSACFSIDGGKLLTGNNEGRLRLWNIGSKEKPRPVETSEKSPVYALVLTDDNKQAITGGLDFVCHMWNLETGEELHRFEGHTNSIYAVAFSKQKNQIATGSPDQSIRIWDTNEERELYTFKGLKGSVFALAYSADGKALIYGCRNGRIELLDFNQARHIRELHNGVGEAQRKLKLDDRDAKSLLLVGEWLAIQGAWEEAIERLGAAKKLSPATFTDKFEYNELLAKCNWIQGMTLEKNELTALARRSFLNAAYEGYKVERERVKGAPESAQRTQDLLRYNLIVTMIDAEMK